MASRALLPKLHYTNNSTCAPKKLTDLEGLFFVFLFFLVFKLYIGCSKNNASYLFAWKLQQIQSVL